MLTAIVPVFFSQPEKEKEKGNWQRDGLEVSTYRSCQASTGIGTSAGMLSRRRRRRNVMTYVQCAHECPSILGVGDGSASLEQRSVQSPSVA